MWPDDAMVGETEDGHDTYEQARAVCDMLERDGLGGRHKFFPLWTRVDKILEPTTITNFQPTYTPEMKAMYEQFRVAVEKLVREHTIQIAGLTEQQLVSALKQAIQCGDFQRLVVGTSDAQQVIYVPYAREQELEARIKDLEVKLIAKRDAIIELGLLFKQSPRGEWFSKQVLEKLLAAGYVTS